jgi:hypothetical protein|tara:strand:- start:2687 stop:3079 length:393 start_codon:yes stop_codon:yes gene_type:complete
MRTAEICPTCAVLQNAECIIYNGAYLGNAVINPGDDLQLILSNINTNLAPSYSDSTPSSPAPYVGKIHVDQSADGKVYVANLAGTASDWEVVVTVPEAGAPEYANNAAALLAGLSVGEVYRTGDLLKIVH